MSPIGGVVGGIALGGALGMAGKGAKGFEFSHFAPKRWIKTLVYQKALLIVR